MSEFRTNKRTKKPFPVSLGGFKRSSVNPKYSEEIRFLPPSAHPWKDKGDGEIEKTIFMGWTPDHRDRVYFEIRLTENISDKPVETITHDIIPPGEKHYTLSMSGYETPSGERAMQSAGQIDMHIRPHFNEYHWENRELAKEMLDVWENWHLNALQAGCIHQKEGDYNDPAISGQVCPETGYKYGHSWLFRKIPDDLLAKVESW